MGGEEAREGGTELKGSRGCSRPDVWPRRTCVCVCVCARARVQGASLYDARLGGGGRLQGTKTRVSIAFCEAFVTTKCSSLAPPSSPLFAPWGPPETPRPALRAGVGGGGRAKPTHSPARPGAQAQLWLSQLRKVSPHCLLCCCLVS